MHPNALVNLLKGERVFLQTHDFPDPDAIASAYALRHFLAAWNISSEICCCGHIDRAAVSQLVTSCNIRILQASAMADMTSTDRIVLVDCQKNNSNVTSLPGTQIACIDHHPTRVDASYNYCDIRQVGACASIIADYFRTAGVEIPKDIATVLLYGIKVDTENLRRGVTDLDLDIFSDLYRIADHSLITALESKTLEFSDLKAFSSAIATIKIVRRIGFSHIPFSCPDALIAQVADFILSIAEVDIAVIWSNRPDGIKLSMRSQLPEINCGAMLSDALAGIGSAGGHAHMAGGFIPQPHLSMISKSPDQIDSSLQTLMLSRIPLHF